MNNTIDVAIVGGGAAGLFLAANLSETLRVFVIEKTKKQASKLLLTGGGRCNYTHSGDSEGLLEHYNSGKDFLRFAIRSMDSQRLIELFQKMGMNSAVDSDGRIFPESYRSSDVKSVLTRQISVSGHRIILGSQVYKISPAPNGVFEVICSSGHILSRTVVVATGGGSYPVTGSSGDGYELAKTLGHTIETPVPALTDLKISGFSFSDLSGVTLKEVTLELWRHEKKVVQKKGSLLLTRQGFSGSAALNISGFARAGDEVVVSFTGKPEAESQEQVKRDLADKGRKTLKRVIIGLGLPVSLSERLCKIANIDPNKTASQVTRQERRRILANILRLRLKIVGKGGFDTAMVTRGGISLDENNPKTMESRLVKGLYFCGEVLDIDGETGGYNLHAAFATAYVASKSIVRKLEKPTFESPDVGRAKTPKRR